MFARSTFALFLILGIALLVGAWWLPPLFWWPLTLAYWAYEFGVTGLMIVSTAFSRRPPPVQAMDTPVSVLIAAHNEADCIAETLHSVLAQQKILCELLVASDGSTDGMNALVARDFPTVRLLDLPKAGKAAALNAALAVANHELVVTLDADTRLAPDALARLIAPFADPTVQAAGGWIFVRNATTAGWLARWQFIEYVKNCLWRNGLARMGVLLQVSGAFGAFRRATLRRLSGFATDSLTEDYEIIYRLHRDFRARREPIRILTVSNAVAYTDGPETMGGFIHQRTRWFAGFLRTLWDYRSLIGNPRFGLLGGLMLPIKTIDAILPLWGLFSWIALGAALAHPAIQMFPRVTNLEWIGVALILKWMTDVAVSALAWRWHLGLTDRLHQPVPAGQRWAAILTETWFFAWFRQIAVIRAYGWFFRGVKEWRQSRWKSAATQPVSS